jgi:hypothetical protein
MFVSGVWKQFPRFTFTTNAYVLSALDFEKSNIVLPQLKLAVSRKSTL